MNQGELMLGLSPVVGLSLSSEQSIRLRQAGADANDLEALLRACAVGLLDAESLEALVKFFCFICPDRKRRLRAVIRLLRWWQDRGHPRRCGADYIYHSAGTQFREFGEGGSNDERCFITRALYLCCEDLRPMLAMRPKSKANVLLRLNWKPDMDTSREALPPLSIAEQGVYAMPS